MLIVIYILFFIFCFIGFRFYSTGYNNDYLSKSQCNAVKGFFIILVFLSHINQYILKSGYRPSSLGDEVYFHITSTVGQLMVVVFLFFSGYGIMESYKIRGSSYLSTMPQKRILVTLLNFDVAVLFFFLLNIILGKSMTLSQVLLSFIAWDSLGNSNWYIFCILLCYSVAYIALTISSNQNRAILLVFCLCVIAMITLSFFKGSWWYNTMLCFPLGMLFSKMKSKVDSFIPSIYIVILVSLTFLFFVFRNCSLSLCGLTYNIESMCYALIIVLLMMKMKSNNKFLQWMGQMLFPLYIYQRLMMIAIFESSGGIIFIATYPMAFILICFVAVVLIANLYPRWQISIQNDWILCGKK